MTAKELQQYLLREFPQENARCEWNGMKETQGVFCRRVPEIRQVSGFSLS